MTFYLSGMSIADSDHQQDTELDEKNNCQSHDGRSLALHVSCGGVDVHVYVGSY